jgi:hypothetical protein
MKISCSVVEQKDHACDLSVLSVSKERSQTYTDSKLFWASRKAPTALAVLTATFPHLYWPHSACCMTVPPMAPAYLEWAARCPLSKLSEHYLKKKDMRISPVTHSLALGTEVWVAEILPFPTRHWVPSMAQTMLVQWAKDGFYFLLYLDQAQLCE